jgi:hypothetical protein
MRTARFELVGDDRPGRKPVRDALLAPHKGNADLPQDWKSQAVQLLLGHAKAESTVRYLGIEVDDALAIAEQVDI